MAKQPSKNLNFTFNSVPLEDDMDEFDLDVKQDVPAVTSFADAGPRRVVDNYDYSVGLGGAADFASGQSDATLAAQIGGTGAAFGADPTGASAGANDPNYDGTAVLESYKLSARTGQPVKFSATLQGNSALSRAVA